MKCQIPFSAKNKKNITTCILLKILSRVLSVNLYLLPDSSFSVKKGLDVTKTCLYNVDPLEPHFYIVKLGFTGISIIFSYFCLKI